MNSVVMILSSSVLLGLFSIGSFHTAFADFELSKPYVLGGEGFAISDISVENSRIELSFFTRDQIGSKINMEIKDGSIMFGEKDFLFKQFDGNILREGRFLRLIGLAEDTQGDQISLRFFGKLLAKSTDELVYELTGTLERSDEKYSLHYITKSGLERAPQLIESQKITEPVEELPIEKEIPETFIQIDVTHYLSVVEQSMFKFTAKVYKVSDEGIIQSRYSLSDVNMTVDIFDSLNNHIQHLEGITNQWGYSDGFLVGSDIPLGTYKMNITAAYQGADDSKEMDFFVLQRRDTRSTPDP